MSRSTGLAATERGVPSKGIAARAKRRRRATSAPPAERVSQFCLGARTAPKSVSRTLRSTAATSQPALKPFGGALRC